jgi:hypothetical protein
MRQSRRFPVRLGTLTGPKRRPFVANLDAPMNAVSGLLLASLCGVALSSCVQITEVKPRAGTYQHPAINEVSEDRLRATVAELDYRRNYFWNPLDNRRARDWVKQNLVSSGYTVTLQGPYRNVVAAPPSAEARSLVLLGAHYDTVPESPGADDNASGVAVCLEAARVLREYGVPVRVVIFNGEENEFLGSSQYVGGLGSAERAGIREVHIFEMVGYYSSAPNSQKTPPELESVGVKWRSTGDFIGLLSNSGSNRIASQVIRHTKAVGSDTHLSSMKVRFGLESKSRTLQRSDHAPFWKAGIPALMWTDTAEFRNSNYHEPTDLPNTLDYHALRDVTRLAVGHVLKTMQIKGR